MFVVGVVEVLEVLLCCFDVFDVLLCGVEVFECVVDCVGVVWIVGWC